MLLSVSHSLYLLIVLAAVAFSTHLHVFCCYFVCFKVMLHGTILQRRFLAQHITTLFQRHRFERLRSNIWTQCCAKNRRCESFRVTSPLCRCFKPCILANRALNIHLFMLSSFSDFMCTSTYNITFCFSCRRDSCPICHSNLNERKNQQNVSFLYCISYFYVQHNRHNSDRAVMSIGLNSLKLVWLVQNQFFVSSLLMGSFYSIFNFSQL